MTTNFDIFDSPPRKRIFLQIIGARWKVIKKLGNGAYGAVYEVQNVKSPGVMAALKVRYKESIAAAIHTLVLYEKKSKKIKTALNVVYCEIQLLDLVSKWKICSDIILSSWTTVQRYTRR